MMMMKMMILNMMMMMKMMILMMMVMMLMMVMRKLMRMIMMIMIKTHYRNVHEDKLEIIQVMGCTVDCSEMVVVKIIYKFLCRLNECSWRHIAIQILYMSVRPSVRPSVKVLVNLFLIAPVRTGSLQL